MAAQASCRCWKAPVLTLSGLTPPEAIQLRSRFTECKFTAIAVLGTLSDDEVYFNLSSRSRGTTLCSDEFFLSSHKRSSICRVSVCSDNHSSGAVGAGPTDAAIRIAFPQGTYQRKPHRSSRRTPEHSVLQSTHAHADHHPLSRRQHRAAESTISRGQECIRLSNCLHILHAPVRCSPCR